MTRVWSVLAENRQTGRVTRVHRKLGGGWSTKPGLGRRKFTKTEAEAATYWVRSAGRNVFRTRSPYPWLILGGGTHWPTDKRLLRRLNRMARRLHRCILIVSGLRTRAQQQVVWDRYQRDGWPIAAYPGTSMHETGRAADCGVVDRGRYTSLADWRPKRVRRLARRVGIVFTVRGEPWHVEAR
ncbi:MAG: M15 family metallopeptidase [Candidatus Nanopelagicales bacterium]|nr:M15 family metallopeptidase [Candidatus Nanopelagicales bacterium]